jgi:hypothetical protein
VKWEDALDANSERLLAHCDRLADAVTGACDDDSFEDLGASASALNNLNVHAHAVTGLDVRKALKLRAFELFDD